MSKIRKIRQTIRSKPTMEGAGVHLHRAFGSPREALIFDPFLLLDDFRNDNPQHYVSGFPWHPHRGIETITYVLKGTVAHGDSMGNNGEITAGDVQWMTAGRGVKHQEMPKGDPDGRMDGFQLWANLPRSHKMMDPRYQDIKSSQIPELSLDDDVKVRVICGEFEGIMGPVENVVIDPLYLDITIPAKTTFTFPVHADYTAFAYVIDGKASFCEESDPFAFQREGSNYFDMDQSSLLGDRTLILFEDGDQIRVVTKNDLVRFLFVSGRPLHEPIAWYGPIVMNSEQELRLAFSELQNGTFIKTSA
ncbi:MAG: pirin family protein [Brevefilum sp.]|nr:pirin family protein [Brevefilum sp.]MDW7755699.1 pirin family protein [Brevefilum sp.]